MDTKDYISLPRSALSSELWLNKDFGCLLWFLIARSDQYGVVTFTIAEIENRLNISRQRVRTMLDKLLKKGIIINRQLTSDKQATTVVIGNQSVEPTSDQQTTNKQPIEKAKVQRKSPAFTPPTEDELRTYIAEKGYHFNPEQFIPYYEMRGWKMKDGKLMSSWKAGCRYWETTWKEKHGEKFYYELQSQQSTRNVIPIQTNRYSELERVADAVLYNAPNFQPSKND